ncbi:MAG: hypothetical protein EOO15_18530 [Chitinophagaceae bacterium]|nr:MAG: hypothetical protein EOO15_18530 [Chitinophagaceae bacterium]
MKRYLPLILVVVLLLVAVVVLVRRSDAGRKFDGRVSLRQEDRVPYGMYLTRRMLPRLFPGTYVYNDHQAPGQWDSLYSYEDRQGLLLMGYYIDADDDEVAKLLSFAAHGNYVYIVGADFSPALCRALRFDSRRAQTTMYDSMSVSLETPRFAPKEYHYPGMDVSGLLIRQAADSSLLLGTRDGGTPNFLQFRIGSGSVFIHASPMAFSNYFVLQPGNEQYVAAALSVMPAGLKRVAWSEYYLSKDANNGNQKEPNWLGVLLQHKAFSWALWLFLLLLLTYGISEMRRRQRWIPPYERPQNDSLDFVKTVGRLYYDKRDHHDLAGKMIQYFLDHVRQQYKIPTSALDEDFMRRLQARSGYPREELDSLMTLIHDIRAVGTTTPAQLADLHYKLENYYRHG